MKATKPPVAIVVKKRKLDEEVIAKAGTLERVIKSVSRQKQEEKMRHPKPATEEFDEWE